MKDNYDYNSFFIDDAIKEALKFKKQNKQKGDKKNEQNSK